MNIHLTRLILTKCITSLTYISTKRFQKFLAVRAKSSGFDLFLISSTDSDREGIYRSKGLFCRLNESCFQTNQRLKPARLSFPDNPELIVILPKRKILKGSDGYFIHYFNSFNSTRSIRASQPLRRPALSTSSQLNST